MKRYSEFINFPIHLWASKEVDKEVPVDEDESSDEDDTCVSNLFFFLAMLVRILPSVCLIIMFNVMNSGKHIFWGRNRRGRC